MDTETEQYFNEYFSLFRTDGWKTFVKEIQANAFTINNVQQIKDADDMYFRKGQLDILASIINLEQTLEAAREQAEADSKEDD